MDPDYKPLQALDLSSYTPDTRSLRQQFVTEATEAINRERKGTQYKPVTPRQIAIKIAHLSDTDLHFFSKRCREAASYGRTFFGGLKIK